MDGSAGVADTESWAGHSVRLNFTCSVAVIIRADLYRAIKFGLWRPNCGGESCHQEARQESFVQVSNKGDLAQMMHLE